MRRKRKLRLHRDTLRELTASDLRHVVGGHSPTANPEGRCISVVVDESVRTCATAPPPISVDQCDGETVDC